MKFLCVPCDTPMKLQTVAPPDRGSLSVVYSCSECGYEIAMLTNAYETQVVQSLGVRISPEAAGGAAKASDGKCPFSAMIPSPGTAAEGSAAKPETGDAAPIRWTAGAEARLERVPSFVRPMARAGIERFAADNGADEVDETILERAREFFGM